MIYICNSMGPRGLRCQLPDGHDGRHEADKDGPEQPCEVCGAIAGDDCKDPKRCQFIREGK